MNKPIKFGTDGWRAVIADDYTFANLERVALATAHYFRRHKKIKNGLVIGSGYNLRESTHDPTAHAELIAIRKAARKSNAWRLTGCTVYVTLEPCLMCMGAMILSRIDRLVYGCRDPKGGAAGTLYDVSGDLRLNHRFPVLAGVREEECSRKLSEFFAALRTRKVTPPATPDT